MSGNLVWLDSADGQLAEERGLGTTCEVCQTNLECLRTQSCMERASITFQYTLTVYCCTVRAPLHYHEIPQHDHVRCQHALQMTETCEVQGNNLGEHKHRGKTERLSLSLLAVGNKHMMP